MMKNKVLKNLSVCGLALSLFATGQSVTTAHNLVHADTNATAVGGGVISTSKVLLQCNNGKVAMTEEVSTENGKSTVKYFLGNKQLQGFDEKANIIAQDSNGIVLEQPDTHAIAIAQNSTDGIIMGTYSGVDLDYLIQTIKQKAAQNKDIIYEHVDTQDFTVDNKKFTVPLCQTEITKTDDGVTVLKNGIGSCYTTNALGTRVMDNVGSTINHEVPSKYSIAKNNDVTVDYHGDSHTYTQNLLDLSNTDNTANESSVTSSSSDKSSSSSVDNNKQTTSSKSSSEDATKSTSKSTSSIVSDKSSSSSVSASTSKTDDKTETSATNSDKKSSATSTTETNDKSSVKSSSSTLSQKSSSLNSQSSSKDLSSSKSDSISDSSNKTESKSESSVSGQKSSSVDSQSSNSNVSSSKSDSKSDSSNDASSKSDSSSILSSSMKSSETEVSQDKSEEADKVAGASSIANSQESSELSYVSSNKNNDADNGTESGTTNTNEGQNDGHTANGVNQGAGTDAGQNANNSNGENGMTATGNNNGETQTGTEGATSAQPETADDTYSPQKAAMLAETNAKAEHSGIIAAIGLAIGTVAGWFGLKKKN